MRIDRVDRLTIQVHELYFPGADFYFGAPNPEAWREILDWCVASGIECNRGRGTRLRFSKEEDVTAFLLRWS